MIGPRPRSRRDYRDDPTGERHDGLPTYTFHSAPPGLFTRRQLRAKGKRPGRQPIAAQVIWVSKRRRSEPGFAYLYRLDLAEDKTPATPAQLARAAKATRAHQIRAAARHGIDLTDNDQSTEEAA